MSSSAGGKKRRDLSNRKLHPEHILSNEQIDKAEKDLMDAEEDLDTLQCAVRDFAGIYLSFPDEFIELRNLFKSLPKDRKRGLQEKFDVLLSHLRELRITFRAYKALEKALVGDVKKVLKEEEKRVTDLDEVVVNHHRAVCIKQDKEAKAARRKGQCPRCHGTGKVVEKTGKKLVRSGKGTRR